MSDEETGAGMLPRTIHITKEGRVRLTLGTLVIGVTKDESLLLLEKLFWDSSGFHGATHYGMRPLDKAEIESHRDPDSDNLSELWKMAVQAGETTDSLEKFAEAANEEADACGLYYPCDDPSFRDDALTAWSDLSDEGRTLAARAMGAGRLVEDIESKEASESTDGYDNFVTFSCTSCGRLGADCGSKEWLDAAIAPKEVLDIIRRFEGSEPMPREKAIELMRRVDALRYEHDLTELREKYGKH